MKIGILTYQNTINFGAALQCYALYKACDDLGNRVEIIDYHNKKIIDSLKPVSMVTNRGASKMNLRSATKLLIMYPLVNSKKRAFKKFETKYMNYSEKIFVTKNEIITSPPKYDKYIIGSDQVWNYNINGMDTTYLMDFVREKERIFTFASSFGIEEIENDKKDTFKKFLGEIPSISVREERGAEILKNILYRDVTVLNDPVFLIPKNEWLKLVGDENLSEKEQIVTYFLNHKTRDDFELALKNEKELSGLRRIKLAGGIKISDFINKKIEVNLSNGPLDFVKHIYQSKYIFTDSFHGTVFSILLNKKFLVFLSGDNGRDSRIINLLNKFGLEDRIYKGDFNNIANNIDFEEINRLCVNSRTRSMNFLKKNL